MISVQHNFPLSQLTSFHLGGPARFFVQVHNVDDLEEALEFSRREGTPWVVIGGGSNVLVSDQGFPGLVIKIEMREVRVESAGFGRAHVMAEAGAPTAQVAAFSLQHGLTGFEWAAGVPGTIGGAVRGNAGASGGEIKDALEGATVFRDNGVVTMSLAECAFGYRESIFKKNPDWIVLAATFSLATGDRAIGIKKIQEFLQYRNQTQPKKYGSSGCGFKNVELIDLSAEQIERLVAAGVPKQMFDRGRVSAGWLIQHAGLAGVREGEAMVSDVHCNFIVNTGNATAADVKILIARVKEQVWEKFGVELQEEIVYIGF